MNERPAPFEVVRDKLPPDCREAIIEAMRRHRIRCPKALLDDVDGFLAASRRCPPPPPTVAAKSIRRQIDALGRALAGLSPEAKELLDLAYVGNHPLPQAERPKGMAYEDPRHLAQLAIAQTEKTHFVRVTGERAGLPVTAHELIERIAAACLQATARYAPEKGAAVNHRRLCFVAGLARIFEHRTGTRPTIGPEGVFSEVLLLVLESCCAESPAMAAYDRRKLIKSAVARNDDADALRAILPHYLGNEAGTMLHLFMAEKPRHKLRNKPKS